MDNETKNRPRRSTREQIKLVDGLSEAALLSLAYNNQVKHLVQKSRAETVRELRAACLMVSDPEKFIFFPLASTLNPRAAGEAMEKHVTIFEKKFCNLNDKDIVLEEIAKLFDSSRLNSSLRDDVILTADELICNALFNAPFSDGKNTNSLSQTISTALLVNTRESVVKMGAYNGFLALSCLDLYGNLKPLRLLERVHKCLHEGPAEAMNYTDSGTAGIGSFMIFNACTSLFMAVREGQMSQFCVLFPLLDSAKARMQKPKNLHWQQITPNRDADSSQG